MCSIISHNLKMDKKVNVCQGQLKLLFTTSLQNNDNNTENISENSINLHRLISWIYKPDIKVSKNYNKVGLQFVHKWVHHSLSFI